jgi:hypothetical protein
MGQGRPQKAPDGTLTYPQRGFEPPPVPFGYRRKTTDLKNADAWTFIPIIPPCDDRTHETTTGNCGAQSIKYFCKGIRFYDLSKCGRCNERA